MHFQALLVNEIWHLTDWLSISHFNHKKEKGKFYALIQAHFDYSILTIAFWLIVNNYDKDINIQQSS